MTVKTVSADTTCQTIYGGGQTCVTSGNIGISKSVKNPQNGAFVANLGMNDPEFNPGQAITFQVTVTNNDSSANTITVTDTIPQFMQFVSGPGNFNNSNDTLTWTVTGLGVGQSQTFTIQGNIVAASSIPQGAICATNQVNESSNNGDGASASSQFCIANSPTPTPTIITTTKGGLPVMTSIPVKTTPPTGPEELPLLALIPGALTGIGLIRKSSKNS